MKNALTLFLFGYLLSLPIMATTKKDREIKEKINHALNEMSCGFFSDDNEQEDMSSETSSIYDYDDWYSSDDSQPVEDDEESIDSSICPKEDGRNKYLRQQSSKRIYDAQRAATISLHALKKEIATLPRDSRRYKKLHRLYNNYVRKLERIAAQNLIESSAKEEPLVVPDDNPDQQRIHINHRQQWSGDFCTPREKKQKSSKQRVRKEQPTILVANDAHFVPMPGRADAHLKPSKFDIIDAMLAIQMNALCGRGW